MKSAVDIVNFSLIWITLGLAMAWPFEPLLFSYIVLGPLHYLTEINWLDKQRYFLRDRDRRVFVWGMVVLVFILTVSFIISDSSAWRWTKPLYESVYNSPANPVSRFVLWSWAIYLVAFVTAAACLFTERRALRLSIILLCLLSSILFYAAPTLAILFGVLLPTIGHVYVFTILFMLYGALKARSFWGYANILSMFLVVAVIAVWPRVVVQNSLSHSVLDLTVASAFLNVDGVICKWLGLIHGDNIDLYSTAVFKVQSFVAFAYTYHYLNWFSKTSIIKWHQVEKKKFTVSAILWAISLSLYKVDYRLGFAAVFALSVLHIVLEFPLNLVSMRGILAAITPKSDQIKPA